MKIISVISRIMFIALVWTIGYTFWFQKLSTALWGFDPAQWRHWTYIWEQWKSGWVIRTPREWCFVIAMFSMIPMWFVGWTILCSISWMSWFKAILMFPIKLIRSRIKNRPSAAKRPKVTKKKSYKQTRPPAVRAASGKVKPIDKAPEPEKEQKPEPHREKKQSHAAPKAEPAPKKEAPRTSPASPASGETIPGIIRSAGYRLIENVKVNGKPVDFAGIASDHILLCLVDSEPGDWLADEERFNDEEPLWFSESNHRISPVRVVLNARDALMPQLSGSARGLDVRPMVIVKQGTIINAEDMFDVWEGLRVDVCRFEDGGPEEIHHLRDSIRHVDGPDDAAYREVSDILG